MYDQPQTRDQLPQTDLRGADVTARWSVPLEPAVTQMTPQRGRQGQPGEQLPVQQVPQQPPSQAIPQQIVSPLGQQPVARPRQRQPQPPQRPSEVQPQLQPPVQQLAQPQQQPQSAQQQRQPQSTRPQPVQRGTPTAQQRQQQAAVVQSAQSPREMARPQLASQPSVDLVETPEALSILVDLPGCEKREIELEGDERTLTISAKRTAEKNDGRFFYHERPEEVERTIDLPANVEIDEAEATYENGILTVTLPKSDDSRRKRIGIQ